MRKKVYDYDYILNGAFLYVIKSGFENFSARSIAKELHISTQPIYLQFENMESLKIKVIKKMFQKIESKYFSEKMTELEYIKALSLFTKDDEPIYLACIRDSYASEKLLVFLFNLYLKSTSPNFRKNDLGAMESFSSLFAKVSSMYYLEKINCCEYKNNFKI